MTRVYVDMVADLFHYGTVEFLKRARALGDYLLVGINSDETVRANKRDPILSMEERIASVAGCRYVDEVVPDAPWVTDAAWIDKHIVDGTVNLVGLITQSFGSAIRLLQTGRIQQYVSFAVAGGLLAAAFLILL